MILGLLRIIGALFALAGPIAAGWGVWYFDHRPAGQPAWGNFDCCLFVHLHLPDSLRVQRDTARADYDALLDQERVQAVRVAALEAAQAKITEAASAHDSAAQAQIQTITRTIIREVPTYVDQKAVADCRVPVGFIRLWNAAASGADPAQLPDPAGRPDDAASGVGLDTVASVSVLDLGAARANAQQLSDLQDWIRAQQAAASK